MPKYIDLDQCGVDPGHGVGFLLEAIREGVSHFSVADRPGYTNQSHKPLLDGWLGETNNVSRFARGLVRCTGRSPNDRVAIEPLTGDDVAAALDSLCYPELR
jgi:hypothetical protein